jgi:hypothetical protein
MDDLYCSGEEELAEAGSFTVGKIYFQKIASAAFADDFPLSQLGRVKQSNFQLFISSKS